MRYEFRENHDGKEMYDSQEGYYMNDDECLQQLNDQAAEIKERTGGKTMNKYVLSAMDKSKTEKELRRNVAAADAAVDAAADAAAAAAYDAVDAAAAAAVAAVAVDAYNVEYWLDRYFERTGENRKDYVKAIKELEK